MHSQKRSAGESEGGGNGDRRDAQSRTLCFLISPEFNNLTVINFARYAVRRSRNQRFFKEKGTFLDFLANRQVNFTTLKRYKNRTAVRHYCCGVSQRGIFNNKKCSRWVDVFFFKTAEYFFLKRKKKTKEKKKHKKHVKHDSLLCSYLVLKLSVRLSSSLKTSIRVI